MAYFDCLVWNWTTLKWFVKCWARLWLWYSNRKKKQILRVISSIHLVGATKDGFDGCIPQLQIWKITHYLRLSISISYAEPTSCAAHELNTTDYCGTKKHELNEVLIVYDLVHLLRGVGTLIARICLSNESFENSFIALAYLLKALNWSQSPLKMHRKYNFQSEFTAWEDHNRNSIPLINIIERNSD